MPPLATEILGRESEPLFDACRIAIAEQQRLFFEQNPGIMHHMVRPPSNPKEAGFKVEIFADEHPPPHFRVKYQHMTANFSITTCERLNGSLPLRDRDIRKWWQKYRLAIASAWNAHRPSDCTVGPVDIDALGWSN